jgi:hypothetical protein
MYTSYEVWRTSIASTLASRLTCAFFYASKHNAREVAHTSKHASWAIKAYVAFTAENQSFAFEKYLKSASGRAFARKRL